MKVPHKLITKELLFEFGYITCGEYFLNWNGIYVIKKGEIWEYGSPGHHTIDKEHPLIKHGEVQYLDELDAYQWKRSGRGLQHFNEEKLHVYYNKYGKNYQSLWQRIKSFILNLYVKH